MKVKLLSFLLYLPILGLLIPGCKKVYDENTILSAGVLNFTVSESQRTLINSSRGKSFEINDPVPGLILEGNSFPLDRFEVRGESTLNFERKGFSVNMNRKIPLYIPYEQVERNFEKFKLLALVYDYTYIENSIATGLFREVNLWPVYSFFTEVSLNNHTQGLYHFIEDPDQYFIEERNSSFVLRRGYDHSVKAYSANPDIKYDLLVYLSRIEKIYSDIVSYSGYELYDSLSAKMDLEQYFTKLSIDLLLKNGDYTDEIFFYSKMKNNKEIFGVFPWDYDDLFSDKPHEIGKSWATGSVFGDRKYNSMNDIIADVGSKLLYSIEDDLDYKIAKDTVLYQKYLTTLRTVIEKIDPVSLDKIFDYTFEQISPFYSNDAIVEQSKYDVNETNYDLFIKNLDEKRQMMKDRRNWILQELGLQQNR